MSSNGATIAVQVEWVIDTHGMKEALTNSSKAVRAKVILAIETRRMHVLKSVSREIKELYPHLWAEFHAIKNKKYHSPTIDAECAASTLTEAYGASVLGSVPTKEHFQSIASAKLMKCVLVTGGKALSHAKSIGVKCKLTPPVALSPTEVAALV